MSSDAASSVAASSLLTNLSSKLPSNGREGLVDVILDVRAVGWSLMCPGLGSSSSSTRPSALGSEGSPPMAGEGASASGDGGGLRDFERRASSCRKGMGEKRGVDGAD
ncbi:hypothetical protein LshimejAT787_0209880 [Lyophyllum shimeji]|uniref:Uncharacterized protein n=1 Tax=Lyophyllum shimeji TaxID=47721 RepID=A0A9P3UJ81_LYOSH|nr:hypothetical protein LshimejAT787_0209880 [Lyophyllum shimeji]